MKTEMTKVRRFQLEARWLLVCWCAISPLRAAFGQQAADAVQSTEAIRAVAESFVKEQLPHDASVAGVTAGALDGRLRLVHCAGGLTGHLPPGATLQARVLVSVRCEGGPVRWTVYVPVTIESRIAVLVLKRPVSRDERLTGADVTVETRKMVGLNGMAYLGDVNDLQSRSVERPLPVGTVLTADMFKPERVIHQGQDVTLVASAGGIEVRAAGRALSDGSTGARVKVQNLSSLKVVEGVVEGPDVVRVAR